MTDHTIPQVPAIDPHVRPKTAGEMAADGEREGPVLDHASPPDEIETELPPGSAGGRETATTSPITPPPD